MLSSKHHRRTKRSHRSFAISGNDRKLFTWMGTHRYQLLFLLLQSTTHEIWPLRQLFVRPPYHLSALASVHIWKACTLFLAKMLSNPAFCALFFANWINQTEQKQILRAHVPLTFWPLNSQQHSEFIFHYVLSNYKWPSWRFTLFISPSFGIKVHCNFPKIWEQTVIYKLGFITKTPRLNGILKASTRFGATELKFPD